MALPPPRVVRRGPLSAVAGAVRQSPAGAGLRAALGGGQQPTPRGPWQNVDPVPERGSLANPFTDSMAPKPQGPQLARPVSNAGSNGSNARYYIGPGSGLQRGERGWTDGVYWYDENGLSLDRPDAHVEGLGPANESERYDPWSGRGALPMAPQAPSAPAQAGPQVPRGVEFARGLLEAGQQRTQPAAGFDSGQDDPQSSLAALLQALLGRVPGKGGSRNHIPA